jgi:hypothetical protein
MPVQIAAPDGSIVEFPDGTPDDVMANAMRETFGGPTDNPAPQDLRTASADTQDLAASLSNMTQNPAEAIDAQQVEDAKNKRDEFYSRGIYAGSMNPLGPVAKSIDAFASGAQRAPLFGWDDEAVAGARSLAGNTDYTTAQQQEDAKKTAMRQQNPIASTSGELAGGLATGGTVARTGATMAGRSLPYIGRAGGAALEGGAYGAVTGAGEAKPGERGQGALMGGTVGAVTGGVASKTGDMLASRFAKKAAEASAPSIDDLATSADALYTQAKQSGVAIQPQSADRMINNMKFVAGRPNDKLRPRTAGLIEDIQTEIGQPMSIDRFHELRQEVGKAMKGADETDTRTLMRMKNVLDGFADNLSASDVTGGNPANFQLLKDANKLWAQKSKAQTIAELFDLADVKSAKYSQSGMFNAVRDKSSQLYTRIVKGQEKGFTASETALIRSLAKGEMTPKVVNWLGKFAPRGVVSTGAGSAVGGLLGSMFGPVGTAVGMATPGVVGFGAASLADRAAVGGLRSLGQAAASGNAPVLGAITNKTVPFIGGTVSPLVSQIVRTR